ncbi:tubby C-terminal domain-like protein [Bacillus safensis]|uniref:tubby C-terminal domain-like protein n=1 Tax=Bacillus safensis TaxID=561879 RepID=UPI003F7C9BF5
MSPKNKWEIKMEFGYFKKPVIKKTTKCIPIINKDGVNIGFIKRFYTNKVEKLIDYIFDEFYVNVEVMDSNSNMVVTAIENKSLQSMFRSNWVIECKDKGKLILEDRTKIKINPMMKLVIDDTTYYLKKGFANNRVRLESSEQTKAEITYDKIIPPATVSIEKKQGDLSLHLIACLYYIFMLRE